MSQKPRFQIIVAKLDGEAVQVVYTDEIAKDIAYVLANSLSTFDSIEEYNEYLEDKE